MCRQLNKLKHIYIFGSRIRRYPMDATDSLDDGDEVEREQAIMDEHESRVAHIVVSLKEVSSPAESMIKPESKELDVL